ncbi:hypothetical protein R0131_12595 [Clostridium sp. AL.422]|uniref:hypothetical protein n=1 Tax=Clostridium TaxID=1485 RepID=UPI00293DD59E|nr:MULTISPECIES: hypothetical protein [unclassified Clostridium]MDV4151664.1 hypothetical protein [Clostridium sp. AL.422]
MKIKSIIKYNINSLKNSIAIYYAIFITVCVASVILSRTGNVSSSGIELSSVIFIFVAGLNLFKENFYFMKSNNVSRKDFIYGTALSMIPVAVGMSIIDIIINRIYNIFMKCPTLYDMAYANIGKGHFDNSVNWVQSNSIETLLSSIAFQGALCIFAISLGFLITIIYYRCNKLMKVVVSILPVILFNLGGIVDVFYPDLTANIYKFIAIIFGINTGNVYAAILTFIVLFIIFIGLARFLTRKAIIKQ